MDIWDMFLHIEINNLMYNRIYKKAQIANS